MNENGLRVVVSNCPERLTEEFLREASPLEDPFAQDLVVVQTRAMERFLSLKMASHAGVCAGVRFPFPVALVYSLFMQALPEAPRDEFFSQATMAWSILEAAPDIAAHPDAAPLGCYLADGDEFKASQLAAVLAGLFDQYLIFRPEIIEAWEGEKSATDEPHAAWQALLWKAVARGHEAEHRVALRRAFLDRVNAGLDIPGLPRRLFVFGVASLPPFYLDVFSALAKRIPVTVYQLGHCSDQSPASMTAGLDSVGAEFRALMAKTGGTEIRLPVEPGNDSLLASLRRDLGHGLPSNCKALVQPDDCTVQFHSCHTAMREVEILHQNLLRLLRDMPDLEPRDILVLCPDLATYAPYVNAVFGSPPEEHFLIPYSLTRRTLQEESIVTKSFLSVLDLAGDRFELPRVLDLLQCPQVRKRFGLSGADLPTLQAWFMEAGARWGLDVQERIDLGLPGYREYTWEAAMERLILGYALPPRDRRLFRDAAPLDLVEGSRAALLDGGVHFCRTLFGHALKLREKRQAREWADLLREMLDALFLECGGDDDEDLGDLRQALRDMAESARLAGPTRMFGLAPVREDLLRRLGDIGSGGRALPGGVTFVPTGEMRQIPFRVVCLMGMNDAIFPRSDVRSSFDLMARAPRAGDRSLRGDDRRIFLEAVLCARDVLCVSFLGQSMEDNAPLPPSVLVSELMDHIADHYEAPEGRSPLPALTRTHRLQAFHPDYFREGTGLFSFHGEPQPPGEDLEPAGIEGGTAALVVRASLPEAGEEWKTVDLASLRAFLANPSRFYLERRLQLTLSPDAALPSAEEPLTGIEGMGAYSLGQELLRSDSLEEQDITRLITALTAEHRLPVGGLGGRMVEDLATRARSLLRTKDEITAGVPPLAPIAEEVETGGRRLHGRLQGLHQVGLVRLRLATIKAKDILSAWADHLFLNALVVGGSYPALPRETWVIGTNGVLALKPEDEPVATLAELLEILALGLQRPLPFFPRTSREWFEAITGLKPEKAREKASAAWLGSSWNKQPGESTDAHMGFCFPDSSCLDCPDFRDLAERIWRPCVNMEEWR